MIETMDRNRDSITMEISTLVFYMKGLDFNDAWLLSDKQRKIMAKVIEKHYEAVNGTKGSKLIG